MIKHHFKIPLHCFCLTGLREKSEDVECFLFFNRASVSQAPSVTEVFKKKKGKFDAHLLCNLAI